MPSLAFLQNLTDVQFPGDNTPVPNVHKMFDVVLSETRSIFYSAVHFIRVVFVSLLMPYVRHAVLE